MLFRRLLVPTSALTNKMLLPKVYDDYAKPGTLKRFFAIKGAQIQESSLTIDNIKQLYDPTSNLFI
jgi:hypothetical protein